MEQPEQSELVQEQNKVFEICQKIIDAGKWEALVPNIETKPKLSPEQVNLHEKLNILVPLQALALRSTAEQRKEWFDLKAQAHISATQKSTVNPSVNNQSPKEEALSLLSRIHTYQQPIIQSQAPSVFETHQRARITFDLISYLLDPIIENGKRK
jgi:hypothetical protein